MSEKMSITFDIFVGSLLLSTTEESLKTLFEKFGKIVQTKIMDKTPGPGLKFGFVHFSKEGDALKAIEEMNGFMYNGVALHVKKSDWWLKREGKGGNKSGNLSKPPIKIQGKQSPSGIGTWQPPSQESGKSNYGSQPYGNSTSTTGLLPHPKENAATRTIKESIAVTHVEDPVTFYAYYASKNSELENLAAELQDVCPNLNPLHGDPVENQLYASVFSADKNWYRCRVIDTDKKRNRSLIQYVDFGNSEKVHNSCMVELPPRLQVTSPHAMKCVLKHVAPVPNNKAVFDEALSFMKHLLIDQLSTAVLHTVANMNHLLVSELYQNGVNIVEAMIKKNYIVDCISSETSRSVPPACNGKPLLGSKHNHVPTEKYVKTYGDPSMQYNSLLNNQEKAHLLTENKKLKHEMSQVKGKQKALQAELEAVSQNLSKSNPFTELPTTLVELGKVSLMRQQLPVRPDSTDYISMAISILKDNQDGVSAFDSDVRKNIQRAVTQYYQMQEQILECSNKEDLLKMVQERNTLRDKLQVELTAFCDLIHSDRVIEKVHSFENVLADLQRVYKPFLNMRTFSDTDLPLEELYNFYTTTKSIKQQEFLALQVKTNMAHHNFMKEIKPAFQAIDQSHEKYVSLPEVTQALAELQECLNNEACICNLEGQNEASIVSVLSQLLCSKVESELESIKDLEVMGKQYSSLLKELALASSETSAEMEQLAENRKQRKKLKSQLRHILADKMDLEESEDASESEAAKINLRLSEVRLELHHSIVEEETLITNIAQLQETAFPEFEHLYPDLRLREYNNYNGFVKFGLEIEHFDLHPLPSLYSTETHYTSTFLDKTIRLRELQLGSESLKEELLKNVVQYSDTTHPNLLPVEAVFFTKKFIHAYVQQPLLPTLESFVEKNNPLTLGQVCSILREVLEALTALHARGIVHGSLHPSTIYMALEKQAVLDSVSFLPHKSTGFLPLVNGISFQLDPRSFRTADDLYSFACLALWLIYPKTEFAHTSFGTPDLTGLEMQVWSGQILAMVQEILKARPTNIQVSDFLNHAALNQDPQLLQVLIVAEPVPESDLEDASSEISSPIFKSDMDETEECPAKEEEDNSTLAGVDDCSYVREIKDDSSDDNSAEDTGQMFDSMRQKVCALGLSETQEA